MGCSFRTVRGETLDTENWVESLIINIIGTDASRPDVSCGHRPGTRGGWNWTEAFRRDGRRNGTSLRQQPITGGVVGGVTEGLLIAEARLADDLDKLVQAGIVRTMTVKASYIGRNRAHALISYEGERGREGRVGLSGERLAQGWVWASQRALPAAA